MKKKLVLFLLCVASITLYAQTTLKLEIVPQKGKGPKLNEEMWLEAWLTNNTNKEIKIFKIGNCEADWEGYQAEWKMQKDGEEVALQSFRDGTTERFSENHIITIAPGGKVYAGLLRKKIETFGKYKVEYHLSAGPNKVNLNYAKNSTAKELAKQITNFNSSAVYEFEIKGYEFEKVNVQRSDISEAALKKKPVVYLRNAFSNPSEVYKLKISGNITPEELAQVCKFQNVRELELNGLKGITALPANLSTLDLHKVAFSNLPVKEYPIEYGNWKNVKHLSLQNMRGDFPQFINKLENLEELYITYNNMREVSTGIGNLRKLRILVLNGYGQKLKLPADMSELPALKEISINRAILDEFPPVWGSRGLTNIGLTETYVPVIGENISNLVELRYLSIVQGKLTKLPQGFSKLKNLELADFTHNEFTTFPTELYSCTSLTSINLNFNSINKFDEGIDKLINLSVLSIEFNMLTELPLSLADCPKLTMVDVRYSKEKISGKGKKKLEDKLGAKFMQ
ncbi:MAG: leucine-rich repeat domain-containing protein [Bacteroidales bacterium]|nr:leucine-rich repeat domain-containing protein [Bacteroidales bacterium]